VVVLRPHESTAARMYYMVTSAAFLEAAAYIRIASYIAILNLDT